MQRRRDLLLLSTALFCAFAFSACTTNGSGTPDAGVVADGAVAEDAALVDGSTVDAVNVDGAVSDGRVVDGQTSDRAVDARPSDAVAADARVVDARTPDGTVFCALQNPRMGVTTPFIGATGLQTRIVSTIGRAQSTIEIMIYSFTVNAIIDALKQAKARGVQVRVIVDRTEVQNQATATSLMAAGVEVRNSPMRFTYSHSKVMIIDGTEAIVMSANFDGYSMNSERNYGVVLHDPADIEDLQTIFEADWMSGPEPALPCTRLIVSPTTSRTEIEDLIRSATQTLDMELMYLSDTSLLNLVKARKQAGVAVRVLLADPAWMTANTQTATNLRSAGIEVRFLKTMEIHAKLIVANGVPLVGSQNMSFTSLERNREIGVLLDDPAHAAPIVSQFAADWAAGVAQ